MSFQSPEFLLLLPWVIALHWLLPHKMRWAVLLAVSWLIYFRWNVWTGLLLAAMTVVTWLCGKRIEAAPSQGGRRAWLILSGIASLGSLAVFKYTGFFARLLGAELPFSLFLPIGISFYTFQTFSYSIDIYRGEQRAEKHFGFYALFVSYFPQLVAGPIERYRSLMPQLRRRRQFSAAKMAEGGWLMLTGYFKKLVIADSLAPYVDAVFAEPGAAAGWEVIAAILLFGIQIYCDFSGYSDIARGVSCCFGIELSENFRRPYLADSVEEFWKRWHISLTKWFTDYVYIPLGGSRRGRARHLINILVVFLLSGFWHGADWGFLLWGLIHGLYRIAELISRQMGYSSKLPKGLRRLRTFLLVSIPWVFFRAESLQASILMLQRVFVSWSGSVGGLSGLLPLLPLLISLPLIDRVRERKGGWSPSRRALIMVLMIISISLAWLAQMTGGGENAFIYFQF